MTLQQIPESQWVRSEFASFWRGPDIEIIVVQNYGADESWSWTTRGWRQPSEADGADRWGWVNTSTRAACEKHALAFYLSKDE